MMQEEDSAAHLLDESSFSIVEDPIETNAKANISDRVKKSFRDASEKIRSLSGSKDNSFARLIHRFHPKTASQLDTQEDNPGNNVSPNAVPIITAFTQKTKKFIVSKRKSLSSRTKTTPSRATTKVKGAVKSLFSVTIMDTLRYIRAITSPSSNTPRRSQKDPGLAAILEEPETLQTEVIQQTLYSIDDSSSTRDEVPVLSLEQYQQLLEWEENGTGQNPERDHLVTLSTADLKRLDKTIIKKVEVKKLYISPPSSPVDIESPSQYLDEETQQLIKNAKGTDLLKLVRPQPGWHTVSISNHPALFEAPENMSDYYRMPIIEDSRIGRFKFNPYNLTTSSGSDTILFSPDGVAFKPPHQMNSPQSVILYLFGKGQSEWDIANILGPFEEGFFEIRPTCVYKDIVIPAHWELNDGVIAKLKDICVPEENLNPWWEGEFDMQGLRIPECFRALQRIGRARPVLLMVQETIEDYLYFRLTNGDKARLEEEAF